MIRNLHKIFLISLKNVAPAYLFPENVLQCFVQVCCILAVANIMRLITNMDSQSLLCSITNCIVQSVNCRWVHVYLLSVLEFGQNAVKP